jgi:RNA polymerase sigma factor (sigma-70 family)
MANGRRTGVEGHLRTLWGAGAIGEADDAALIARFSAASSPAAPGRDEAAEAAFRVLVERHGPMVRRVCRQVIGDGHAAQDAAQAVFLVLARKARSIRVRGSVAPWLHGVARRVALRARSRAAGRCASEERAAKAASEGRTAVSTPEAGGDWDAVHEEVGRLPEKYRTPVVLCYLEGQTYEEAARRIGCPVGTVRVRLSRARDRLRDRLTRRGFGPARLGAVGWFADGLRATEPAGAAPVGWVDATAEAARAFVSSRVAAAGTVSASVLTLSEEVIRTMALAHLKTVGAGVLALGLIGVGTRGLIGQEPASEKAPAAAPKPAEKPATTPPLVDREREQDPRLLQVDRERLLAVKLLQSARQRLEAQRAFYEEGRITIDRYLDASDQVMGAEMQVATNREERTAAARANLERHKEIETRERKELEEGKSTVADVAEATQRREAAELALIRAGENGGHDDFAALERRLSAVERKLGRLLQILEARGAFKPSDLLRGDVPPTAPERPVERPRP